MMFILFTLMPMWTDICINFQTMYHVKNMTRRWKAWNDKILKNNTPNSYGKGPWMINQNKKQKYPAISQND